jgi:putative tricarboxylic transport membrane protein
MNKKDCMGGGIFVALGVFIWAVTFSFPSLEGGHPGPSLFPRVLGTLFVFFGGIVLIQGWKTEGVAGEMPPEEGVPLNYFNPALVILLISGFIVFANKLGFLLTGFAVLFLLMMKLKVSLFKRSLVSIALVCFVYFMFAKVLRVPLPKGLWGW